MGAHGTQPFAQVRGIFLDLWNTVAFTDHSPNPIAALASAFGIEGAPGWRRAIERAIMTRRMSGISEALDAIATATGREVSGRWTRRELVLLWGEASNRNCLYRDALPTLQRLRAARLRIGILSNTQSFDLDFMQRQGLASLVDETCLSCDCGMLKPDPEIYRHAAGRMGLPPERVLMVGDSPAEDLEGPGRAGWRAALLDRTGATPGALTSLTDLPGLIISSSPS